MFFWRNKISHIIAGHQNNLGNSAFWLAEIHHSRYETSDVYFHTSIPVNITFIFLHLAKNVDREFPKWYALNGYLYFRVKCNPSSCTAFGTAAVAQSVFNPPTIMNWHKHLNFKSLQFCLITYSSYNKFYGRWLTLNHCTLPYNFITVWHSKFLWTQMIIFEYLLPLWTDKNILISNHYFSASRVCQIVKRFMVEDLCRIIVNYFITVRQTIILKTKLKVKFVMSYIHWMLKYELIYAISSFTQWPTL